MNTNYTLIVNAARLGRSYTNVRNALIAVALVNGSKQSDIVKQTGVDKGDVSRLNKSVNALSATARKTLVRLSKHVDSLAAEGLDVRGETFEAFEKFGATLTRKRPTAQTVAARAVDRAEGKEPQQDDTPAAPVAVAPSGMSAADIVAALAVLRDAARVAKWDADTAAAVEDITREFIDITMPANERY